jgi:hypothetical protein
MVALYRCRGLAGEPGLQYLRLCGQDGIIFLAGTM